MPQLFSNRKKINVTPINYRDCQRGGEREREREMQPKKQRPKLNAKLDTDTDVKKTCNRFVL
jgi:hypothetical protein